MTFEAGIVALKMRDFKSIKDTLLTPVSIFLLKGVMPLAEKIGLADQCNLKIKNIYRRRYEKITVKIKIDRDKKVDIVYRKNAKKHCKELAGLISKRLSFFRHEMPDDIFFKTNQMVSNCIEQLDFYKLLSIYNVVSGENVVEVSKDIVEIIYFYRENLSDDSFRFTVK